MITGVHALIYSKDAPALRAFLGKILRFSAVDAGGGWLIFALPPAELGIHPTKRKTYHELTLMCDDVAATVKKLKRRGVRFIGKITDAGWGVLAMIALPGGGELRLYEPKHSTAIAGQKKRKARV